MMSWIELDRYRANDDFFGRPFIDIDQEEELPARHRYIHGGFEGTDTRFSFRFPPADRWQGRLYQPLEGANAGHEHANTGPLGAVTGGLEMAFRAGAYTVESNMGHIGDVMDAKAGPDPTIYGWRAAAEAARFSKFVAEQVYDAPPHHAYIFGGSGGARRSPLCLAYAPGVWDGCLPYMGDNSDGDHGDMRRLRGATPNFSSMFNVQRVLGDKVFALMDAMWPGGSTEPFEGLNSHQREELATLYRLGYPRGDEFMIAQPMGQMWLWASMAERITAEDPYFKAFWSEAGHVGHDEPQHVADDLINVRTRVKRSLTPKEIVAEPTFQGRDHARLRAMASIFADMNNMWDTPIALQMENVPPGYSLGAGLKVLSGAAAGRQLYCTAGFGDVWMCDGAAEASNLRFTGVDAGDEVHLDNRDFLAYCYYYRHHIMNGVEYDFLRLNGQPIYKQYDHPEMSPFMGVLHTGRFEGKMLWVHHTHDASLWPAQGVGMKNNVERERGVEAPNYFRLRWSENAEHGPPAMAASPPGRNNRTWLIEYQPIIEQSLLDLIAWVEEGIEPADTKFELKDGQIILPATAAERGGIQPVIGVTANGSVRCEVKVGENVRLKAHAEVPPGAGRLISAAWDFDGKGKYPDKIALDGSKAQASFEIEHRFEKAGTYFVTALVEAHRDGKVDAVGARIPNLASARVIVSGS
jgi:hypothetical protein